MDTNTIAPGARVRSTVPTPGFGWIGTVTSFDPERFPAFPYYVQWDCGTSELCSVGELEVLSEVVA